MAWYECTGGSGGGGGGLTLPTIVSVQSVNGASSTVMSYTFTEAGTFQVYGHHKYGDAVVTAPTLALNGTAVTVSTTGNGYGIFCYAEISVSANDVLTCTPTATQANSGRQLVVIKDSDISKFTLIGYAPNDGSTYNITGADISLEVYNMGYWQGRNNYRYHMIAGEATSVPITGGSDFYYGGSYAIKLL